MNDLFDYLLAIQKGGGGSNDVFIAEYGTTTLADIQTAVANGKVVVLKVYSEALGSYVVYTNVVGSVSQDPSLEPNPFVKFVCYDGKHIYTATINSLNQWTQNIENSSNGFIAIYGTTTFAEIENAINDGKVVICNIDAAYLYLTSKTTHYISFSLAALDAATIATVDDNNTWSNNRYTYSKVFQVHQGGAQATSYNDILSYYNLGYICVLKVNNMVYIAMEPRNNTIVFISFSSGTNSILYQIINKNNVWTEETVNFFTEEQNVSDAGKILSVSPSGYVDWILEKIFLGVYGTTTYPEIYQAVMVEGKFVVIGDLTSMKYYIAAYADLQGRLYFTCDNKLIYIDPVNGWSNEIDNSPVFYATENVTTFDEIATAYRAGKVCCVNDGNDIYTLSYIAFDTGATFAHPTANGNSFKNVNISDVWS